MLAGNSLCITEIFLWIPGVSCWQLWVVSRWLDVISGRLVVAVVWRGRVDGALGGGLLVRRRLLWGLGVHHLLWRHATRLCHVLLLGVAAHHLSIRRHNRLEDIATMYSVKLENIIPMYSTKLEDMVTMHSAKLDNIVENVQCILPKIYS